MGRNVDVFLRGGLGNQLFQYSFGLEASLRLGFPLKLRTDLLPMSQDSIGHVSRFPFALAQLGVTASNRWNLKQPSNGTSFVSKILQFQRAAAGTHCAQFLRRGFLACEHKHEFQDITYPHWINSLCLRSDTALEHLPIIRKQLYNLKDIGDDYRQMLEISRRVSILAVHFRQGDYLRHQTKYGSLNLNYFRDAITPHLGPGVSVWVFSDSDFTESELGTELYREFADKWIGPDVAMTPLELVSIMARAKYFVGSNSTLSWWVGVLGYENSSNICMPLIKEAQSNVTTQLGDMSGWQVIPV
ncbi:hypothetical protein N9K76_01800 [Aquiluna sp.]|nr:hypothetical protein [Aquiluna sp.]